MMVDGVAACDDSGRSFLFRRLTAPQEARRAWGLTELAGSSGSINLMFGRWRKLSECLSVDRRGKLLIAERDERVVAAAKDAAGDFDRGAVVAEAGLELAVVVAVGGGVPGGG